MRIENTTVVTVNHSATNHIPKNRDIKDLAYSHFKNVSFKVLNGEPEKEWEKYLKKNGKDTVVVMGTWSRMLDASMSNKIKVQLFITH